MAGGFIGRLEAWQGGARWRVADRGKCRARIDFSGQQNCLAVNGLEAGAEPSLTAPDKQTEACQPPTPGSGQRRSRQEGPDSMAVCTYPRQQSLQ